MRAERTLTFRIPGREVSGERILESLFAVAHRRLSSGEVARFIGASQPYAGACLAILEQLKLVDAIGEGYQCIPLVAEDLKRLKIEQRYVVLARYAMRYKPFVEFVALIHKGYSVDEAATKANVIYALGTKDHFVEKSLLELGLSSHLLRKLDNGYGLNVVIEELPPDYIDRLKEATRGEVQARLFVRERLGDVAYQYLGEEQVDDFVHALLEFRKDPRDAIGAVGRSVEDFLRMSASEKGAVDYTECNGLIELSNRMRSESPPLLLQGHVARTHFVGMIRNPGGGHGKDKETLERWTVSPEAALEVILVGLSLVRSACAYLFAAQQAL